MTPPAATVPALGSVGRRGALAYEFDHDGSRTVLTRSFCTSPWHHFPPTYLDDSGCAYTWLVNPSGGLVGGDQVTIAADLLAGTQVLMTSPSANRVYRSLGEPSVQRVELTLGPRARLEWMPELTIPFAGSNFLQSINVTLGAGATLILWDAMASGRVARGERWAFARYRNAITITLASGARVLERYDLEPPADCLPGFVTEWDYIGSLLILGDEVAGERRARLEADLAEVLERQPRELLGGLSEPAAPGLVVKVVARSAPVLLAFLDSAWARTRACLWEFPAPILRKY